MQERNEQTKQQYYKALKQPTPLKGQGMFHHRMHGQKQSAVGATVKPVRKLPSGDKSAFDRQPVNLFG